MGILLIRHGETPLNVTRVLQPPDTPLGPRGLEQAQALAQRLAGLNVQWILSSDLLRARQTAEVIAAATGAPLDFTEVLRERDFGDWRGLAYDALTVDPLAVRDAPPGGESADGFEARVAAAFARIVGLAGALAQGTPTRPGRRARLAVVTHGLVVRAMLTGHIRLPDGVRQPTHLGNTGVTEFGASPPHLACQVDSTSHLDAASRDDPNALSGG